MSVRPALAGSASLLTIALAVAASPAFAQDDPALPPETEQAEAAQEGVILVTGTRLARDPNATAPSPITTVTATEIRSTGQSDVTEVLREVPALLSSGTTEDSIERGGGGIGQATLNLRGLGSNRTLVLVNGRRHVSGVAGTQTVDIATIPRALIESVDILTGGASSIYGADAVTGVVNFNLRENFDGFEFGAQLGASHDGGGKAVAFDGVWGHNFLDGRANVTVAGSYSFGEELTFGQRDFSANNMQASAGLTYPNPLRRFQRGDITAASTPNFFQRYNLAAGRYPYGFAIPTAEQFATFFPGVTPTAAEQALMDAAANAPSNILGRQPTFAISSASGVIARADFDYFGLDVDNNGVEDCFDSYIGFTFAQCYVTTPGGGVRPFQDGIISSSFNQLGGDGIPESSNFQSLIPESERADINFLGSYEFSPAAQFFTELKYVRTNTVSTPINVNGFYDLLYIAPDNPFIPAVLLPEAIDAGGLFMSRDFEEFASTSKSLRDTYRAVAGLRGELTPNLDYQVHANYGRSKNRTTTQSVLPDRLFAAIDAVQGPNGPVCASDLDPTRVHPGSEFFPVITPGFFTFTPGANSGCVPINMFNGPVGASLQARDWIRPETTTLSVIDQLIFAGDLTGDTGAFFNLPGGALQFAVGAEYRRERSRTEFDPLVLGLLPSGSPAGPAGTFVGDVDPDKQSLTFDTTTRTLNTSGEFDVWEAFAEVRIPILSDRPFFDELTLEGAGRYSDYSTIGRAFTWNVNGTWAPVRDLRFRGTYAVAIRAPNITELFSPQQGAVFRPIDPCNTSGIAALLASDDPENVARGQRRQANCAADGAPPGYEDPLTARFSGTTGGNPDLQEETATTWTVGAVIQPRFLPRLSISADYYNIEIEDAIAAVSAQNIVNSCYESETFPNQYCDLFDRGPNFGFTFLRQTQLNFGRFKTSGVDASIAYNFSLGEHRFGLRGSGNWTEKVDLFFDPADPTVIDPELGEQGYPEWSGVASANWTFRDLTLGYRLQYIGEQALAGVEIERQEVEFGPAGTGPDYFIHDVSFNYEVDSRFTIYGGVNNVTNEEPFANRVSFPVSPLGRFYFVGTRARF